MTLGPAKTGKSSPAGRIRRFGVIYRVKKQKNEMDTYVLYDVNRMPQACYAEDRGDIIEFDSSLDIPPARRQ